MMDECGYRFALFAFEYAFAFGEGGRGRKG